jgi:Cytochrome c
MPDRNVILMYLMWQKILFWLVLVLILVPAAGLAYLYFRSPAQAPARTIKVSMAPERIARGEFIFRNVADCGGCHSPRDFTRIFGPIDFSRQAEGAVLSSLLTGLPGTVVAPNLTSDPETGLGTWTDGEKIRAIREGVDRSGHALFPMMPYAMYRSMSDDDVQSVVAYLNSLPAIKNPLPQTSLNFPVNLFIKSAPQPTGVVPPPDRTNHLKYGEYLATIAGCGDCHTPTEKGQPIPGKEFAGGQEFASAQYGMARSANITPDLETGIGKWSEEYFVKKFHEYEEYSRNGPPKATGPQQFTVMPWLGFSQLSADDLGAIYTFLRTIKPVHNSVETHPGAGPKTGG